LETLVTVVVTINDVVPPSRNDGVPWVTWFIEEGGEAGPFTQIDTNALSPVDPDPRYPAARDITTANGTADNLWYRVRFRDANNDYSEYTEPIWNGLPLELPTIRQVAMHIRERTVTRSTNEFVGTFTADTRPTDDETSETIEMARDDVLTDTGALDAGLQPEAYNAVRALIALRAAMIIERSYYGDQIGANKSPYPALERDYNARLPKVVEAIAEAETTPPGEIVPGDPLGASPDTGGSGGGAGRADFYVPAGSRVYTGSLWLGDGFPQYTMPEPGCPSTETEPF
jgi:hypothetical protein